MSERPPFPDPRQMPRHSFANVVTFTRERATEYREVADDHPSPESEYVASMWNANASWLEAAQAELLRVDVEGE
jgi:hypothetical protein